LKVVFMRVLFRRRGQVGSLSHNEAAMRGGDVDVSRGRKEA
jgi:hypothetical protein